MSVRAAIRFLIAFVLALAPLVQAATGAGRYLDVDAYLDSAFPAGVPAPRTLWVDGELRQAVEDALGSRFPTLRVRYWYDGATSAWILDEIGKELPITIGVTVSGDAIDAVRILEFRESRGWEIRYPFFTDQFRGIRLTSEQHLDRRIDGVTGATLSVRAVTRVARVALILHDKVSHPT